MEMGKQVLAELRTVLPVAAAAATIATPAFPVPAVTQPTTAAVAAG